ncbi:hypothetical protein BGZ73_001216 [Actinomortierella ambigua]|nr:hypothetical protein BGZ73_001216 [Actinomortierella ambigua]
MDTIVQDEMPLSSPKSNQSQTEQPSRIRDDAGLKKSNRTARTPKPKRRAKAVKRDIICISSDSEQFPSDFEDILGYTNPKYKIRSDLVTDLAGATQPNTYPSLEDMALSDVHSSPEDKMVPDIQPNTEGEVVPDASTSPEDEVVPDVHLNPEDKVVPDASTSPEDNHLPSTPPSHEDITMPEGKVTLADGDDDDPPKVLDFYSDHAEDFWEQLMREDDVYEDADKNDVLSTESQDNPPF